VKDPPGKGVVNHPVFTSNSVIPAMKQLGTRLVIERASTETLLLREEEKLGVVKRLRGEA
jgi:hypothetical protein